MVFCCRFFFQAEDGIRDLVRSRGLGDVYKRQIVGGPVYPIPAPACLQQHGQPEGDDEAQRDGREDESKRGLDGLPIAAVLREHRLEVGQTRPLGGSKDIVVCEREVQRGHHRRCGEEQERQHPRTDEEIAGQIG